MRVYPKHFRWEGAQERRVAVAVPNLPRPGGFRRWIGLLVLGWVATAASMPAQTSREYDLKAVLLFNLTRFVEWPPESFAGADTPLVIGILGQDPYGKILDDVVRTESYGHHKIEVVRFRDLESVKDCQILYIGADESRNLSRILARLDGQPLLTVGDFEAFSQRGGMVGLNQNAEGKIRLRINLEAVRSSHLTVSGKLLRVAEVVNRGKE